MCPPIFAIMSALRFGKASREVEHEDGKQKGLWIRDHGIVGGGEKSSLSFPLRAGGMADWRALFCHARQDWEDVLRLSAVQIHPALRADVCEGFSSPDLRAEDAEIKAIRRTGRPARRGCGPLAAGGGREQELDHRLVGMAQLLEQEEGRPDGTRVHAGRREGLCHAEG